MKVQRLLLPALATLSLGLLLALLVPGPWTAWIAVISAGSFPSLLIALALAREGAGRRLVIPLLLLTVLLCGSLAGIFSLAEGSTDGARIFGMPIGMTLMLGGLCLGPLLLVVSTYTITFASRRRKRLPRGEQ